MDQAEFIFHNNCVYFIFYIDSKNVYSVRVGSRLENNTLKIMLYATFI